MTAEQKSTGLAEAEFSFDDRRKLISQTLNAGSTPNSGLPAYYVRDIYPDWFVYVDEQSGKTYRSTYMIGENGAATLGEPDRVLATTVYVKVDEAEAVKEAIASARSGHYDEQSAETLDRLFTQILGEARFHSGGGDNEAAESVRFGSDVVPLVEAGRSKDSDSIPVKLIQPGWGSSGFYPSKVLERDGPNVFRAGTHMYWDHPTVSESVERPERSLRDLAAVLTSDAVYNEDGPEGPGLYAEAKMFSSYKDAVTGMSEHIGLSIRGSGKARSGEMGGRKGKIIEALVAADSVDFVTKPGAGGKILRLFEAARNHKYEEVLETLELEETSKPTSETQNVDDAGNKPDVPADPVKNTESQGGNSVEVTQEQFEKLQESLQALSGRVDDLNEAKSKLETENARLRENLFFRDARDYVAGILTGHGSLPVVTRKRLLEGLTTQAVQTEEGKLDREKTQEMVEAQVAEELNYLSEALGGKPFVSGVGEQPETQRSEKEMIEEADRILEEAFGDLGLSETARNIAVRGR